MKDNSLKDKAIDIKGKQYVLVSDRINYFNDTFTNGMIQTKLLSQPQDEMVVMMAKITPDFQVPERYFTGYSQAKWGQGMVNTTAAMENCETSAVGRALGMMGIGVIDSVASVDEINKATNHTQTDYKKHSSPTTVAKKGVNCVHPEDKQKIFTAGPTTSKPGARFSNCEICKNNFRWLDEIK